MLHVIEYAASAAILGAILWAPGYAWARFAGFRLGELRRNAEWVLGALVWIVAIFALCSVGEWNAISLVALAGGSLLAALAARRQRAPDESEVAPRGERVSAAERLAWLAIGAVVVAAGLTAMGPEVSWDGASYHLSVPKRYLEAGGFRVLPFNVYSNWPLAIQLLFSAALLAKDYVLAKLLHFGFGVLLLWALWDACRRGRRATGVLAVALVLASPVVLFELDRAYVDLAQAFLLLSAIRFLVRAKAAGEGSETALLLAGLSCGALAGTKLQGLISAASVGALFLPDLWRAARAGARRPIAAFALRFALPTLALALPWALKSTWSTGNPVFPFFYDTLGGSDWSPRLAEQFSSWQASIGMGREPLDYLLLPVRVLLHPDHFGDALGYHWLAAVPLALAFGWGTPLSRACLGAAGIHFAAWAISAQDSRYLLPVLPLLAVAAAVGAGEVVDRTAERAGAARAALCAAAAGLVLWSGASTLAEGARYAVLFQLRLPELEQSAIDPVFRFVDEALPPDARLLLLHTNQGFFLERDYLSDSFFQASQISDWLRDAAGPGEVRDRLRARHITHVLRFRHDWGHRYPQPLRDLLEDPDLVERVFGSATSRYEILALR